MAINSEIMNQVLIVAIYKARPEWLSTEWLTKKDGSDVFANGMDCSFQHSITYPYPSVIKIKKGCLCDAFDDNDLYAAKPFAAFVAKWFWEKVRAEDFYALRCPVFFRAEAVCNGDQVTINFVLKSAWG